MRQVQILLTDDLNEFVETSVARGQYASGSDMISEALLLLIAQQSDAAKLRWLQEAYRIGVESGEPEELDPETIKAEGRVLMRKAAG